MARTPTDRRAFLMLAAGTLGATLLGGRRLAAAPGLVAAGGAPVYASCLRTDDDRFAVALIDAAGTILRLHPLPDRGHDVAVDPAGGRCVAFARRPGAFAVVFDVAGGAEPQVIPAAPDRSFYGHGVFTADGGLLYATENDDVGGGGVIGLYDARDGFRRIGEIPAGGIGPHELVWAADGRTLAIANGGYETSGAFGRTMIDPTAIASSLVLVDPAAGRVAAEERLDPALAALSIRHLALDGAGAVWFGCQHQGDAAETPPLVGRLRPGGVVDLFELPEEMRAATRNYVGSVAVAGDVVAFSAPRGNLLFALDAATGRFLGSTRLDDGCGLAAAAGGSGLLATSGKGRVARLDATADGLALAPVGRQRVAFDNHLARVG